MDELNLALLQQIANWLHLTEWARGVASALTLWVGCMAILIVVDLKAGRSIEVYASRSFALDILYRVMHVLYVVAMYTPIALATRAAYPELNLELLNSAPLWIAAPVYLLIFDFLAYWIHRAQHSAIWWRFHRVHHSTELLTFASGYRNHPIDQIFAHSMTLLPLLLLGSPVVAWLPYSLLLVFADATHHANLPWRFGRARKLFVSPVFHATHHSLDPEVRDRNFGSLFSMWDFMFGTAVDAERRPDTTGVDGWRVRENWLSHFASAFRRDAVVVSQPTRPDAE